MKKLSITSFIFTLLGWQLCYGVTGSFFNVTTTGTPGDVNVTLCLNGKGPLTCQNYNLSSLDLSILTTVPNHFYPAAGIKVNTPGYAISSGCTPYINGYCLFSVSNSKSAQISLISTNPNPFKLPDGTVILSDGTEVSTANSILLINPSRVYKTRLVTRGGIPSDLNLAYRLKIGNINIPNNILLVDIENPHLGVFGNDTNILIKTTNATTDRTYLVDIIAQGKPNDPIVATLAVSVSPDNIIKSSYVDLTATGSLAQITPAGYNATNMMIFAFADTTTPSINPLFLNGMKNAMNSETVGTINLLSIGGATAVPSTININTVNTIIANITSQINAYNQQLTNGKINGVDLDLENDIDANTINALAKGFDAQGFLVSAAPQAYLTSGSNVDPTNPINLALTSGGPNNTYGSSIASEYIDYIQTQTYNTGGWTVGNIAENQVQFFETISQALNNTVQNSCFSVSPSIVCIPRGTQILIGEPSNAGAAANSANIYGVSVGNAYNQSSILNTLIAEWNNTVIPNYTNISGIMQWSLNNDYFPSAYGDIYAAVGAFSTMVFGATTPIPPTGPYFILQIQNNSQSGTANAYVSATIVSQGNYYVFGNSSNQPIAPSTYQLWGTLASSQNPLTPGVVDSNSLDVIFSGGNTSFTASSIILNGYPSSSSSLASPSFQYACPLVGGTYTFYANHSYNIQLNSAGKSSACAISQV